MKWLSSASHAFAAWLEDPQRIVMFEIIGGFLRMLIALLMIDILAIMSGWLFEPENPLSIAFRIQDQGIFIWKYLPVELILPLVPISDIHYARYLLPSFSAVVFVILACTFFVMDIYNFSSFKPVLQYVLASLFGFNYPRIGIDRGKVQQDGEENALDIIGGPGYVLIQPGNAVMFRHPFHPSGASVTRSYFMAPFEKIGYATSLDDQHCSIDHADAVTRDGIRVMVRNIHFRFRIIPKTENGKAARRTIGNPYPYSEEAMFNMAHNLNVSEKGQTPWHAAVRQALLSGITDFIASHGIDYLIAHRQREKDPRAEIRRSLFSSSITNRLRNSGAELLWVDIGHIDILEEQVDQSRIDMWSTELIGNANVIRAYGDATRQAYHKLGRAESQAELIISITDALDVIEAGEDKTETLRKVLLARTAQVLDAMREQNKV